VPYNRGNEEEVIQCFSPAAKVARGGHGAARGRPTVVAPALFQHGEEEGGRWGQVGQKAEWAGWLLGQLGRKLKKSFQNKILIFEFTKTLEIYTRRFRRNFDTRIFPKFF
jgi:hypothetical protein